MWRGYSSLEEVFKYLDQYSSATLEWSRVTDSPLCSIQRVNGKARYQYVDHSLYWLYSASRRSVTDYPQWDADRDHDQSLSTI